MQGGTLHNTGTCGTFDATQGRSTLWSQLVLWEYCQFAQLTTMGPVSAGGHLLKETEDELCESKADLLAVRTELSKKNDKIIDLERRLTETNEKVSAVSAAKEELVQAMHVKSDTVANLMTQLHKEKQKSRKLVEQLKLLSDSAAPDHHTSNLRRMAASAKGVDMTNHPKSLPSSSVAGPSNGTPQSTPPTHRRMPCPPTTPSPSSAKHVRRASTPSKQSPSPQSRQTSVHRRLPTVPLNEGGEVEGEGLAVAIAEDTPNPGRRCMQDLNPLRQVSIEEVPGYTELMRKEEPDITPALAQQRQLSILPPIDGGPSTNAIADTVEESSEFVLHKISKRSQRRLMGSARIAVVDQAPAGGQQAWMSQLQPQGEGNCK